MEKLQALIDEIENKVLILVDKIQKLEAQNTILEEENQRLLEQIALNKKEELETKELTKQREETEELKTKIDELLRKIDKSLALLISTDNHKN